MVSALTNFDITTSGMSFYKRETTVTVASNSAVQTEAEVDDNPVSAVDNKTQDKGIDTTKQLISGEVIYIASNTEISNESVVSDLKEGETDLSSENLDEESTKTEDGAGEASSVSEGVAETKVETSTDTEESSVVLSENAGNTENTVDSSANIILNTELTDLEEIAVSKLEKTDAIIKNHERAHMNAGGQYAGMAVYEYEEGPDGEKYAVAGTVAIDTSEVKHNPKATIIKMQIVKRAALAPMDPSTEDRIVAKKASSIESKARAELRETETGGKSEIKQLYQQMISLYGKENVKDFSTFSMIAQDF